MSKFNQNVMKIHFTEEFNDIFSYFNFQLMIRINLKMITTYISKGVFPFERSGADIN